MNEKFVIVQILSPIRNTFLNVIRAENENDYRFEMGVMIMQPVEVK